MGGGKCVVNSVDIKAYILLYKVLWIGWAVDMTKKDDSSGTLYYDDAPLMTIKSSTAPSIIGVKIGLSQQSVYNKLVKLIDRYVKKENVL